MVAHAAFVAGPDAVGWRDLDVKSLGARLFKNGAFVAEGIGANVLGDPLYALEWTANHLSGLGLGIAAGEVVHNRDLHRPDAGGLRRLLRRRLRGSGEGRASGCRGPARRSLMRG